MDQEGGPRAGEEGSLGEGSPSAAGRGKQPRKMLFWFHAHAVSETGCWPTSSGFQGRPFPFRDKQGPCRCGSGD